MFLFPCEALQKAWMTRGLCVRLNGHQVQGQITRGACDYSKDVIANRLHSDERIPASRGLSFTDPTMKEGKRNLKQHEHHHLRKPWKLIDQEKDSSSTTPPPPGMVSCLLAYTACPGFCKLSLLYCCPLPLSILYPRRIRVFIMMSD